MSLSIKNKPNNVSVFKIIEIFCGATAAVLYMYFFITQNVVQNSQTFSSASKDDLNIQLGSHSWFLKAEMGLVQLLEWHMSVRTQAMQVEVCLITYSFNHA